MRIGNNHHLARGRCDYFFMQQRTPSTFDQRQLRIKFVGAINADVDSLNLIKAGERIQRVVASSPVLRHVGIPRIFRPVRTPSPSKRIKSTAVDPEPNPTMAPSRTKRRLARAAASFSTPLCSSNDTLQATCAATRKSSWSEALGLLQPAVGATASST